MQFENLTNAEAPPYEPINLGVYDYFLKSAATHRKKIALSYYGRSVSYKALSAAIDSTATALSATGVGRGDVVIVSLPSIPEAVHLFYAINKIGAIFCGMDCRITCDEIREIIAQVKPKLCFVSDFQLKEFENIDDTRVVCVSFAKTLHFLSVFASFFADLFKGRLHLVGKKENIITYSKFISLGQKNADVSFAPVKGDDVCAYFYTSGTTKGKKCVVLTNENINSAVAQYANSQKDLADARRFCNIMPLFTCYGISLGTHLPLTVGLEIRMIPLFFGSRMKQLLLKEKPGYIITVPAHWEHFVKDRFDGADFSFMKGLIVGGDKLDEESENRINEILKTHNSTARVMRGYGLTEASTAVTTQPSNTPRGSVGCAMCWSEIGIFDPETGLRLPPLEKGEICVKGPNLCQGYFEDEEATRALLRTHEDGSLWLHSGDIGYMDEDGFLFFCERIKRIYVRFDGTKISPFAIEQVLQKCPEVSRCLVIAIDDPKHFHGKCAKALIVFKDGAYAETAREKVQKFIHANLPSFMRPTQLEFVDRLPTTINGKLDYFFKPAE